MPELTVTFSEEERQATLLALARLASERPGWVWLLGEIAEKMGGRQLFESFKQGMP